MCNFRESKIDEKDYRHELKRKLEASHSRLVHAVQKFNEPIAKRPINRQDLETFPFMKWVNLNHRVRVRKRANRFGDYLCFDTEMEKDGEFGEHFHDDLIESTEVVYGEMVDTSDGGKIYAPGDVAHYNKGQKHTPIATMKTLLHVLFK